MSEHTKEPWGTAQCSGGGLILVRGDADQNIKIFPAEDARRIVACVNACQGLTTETLETFGEAIPSGMVHYLEQAKRERDEAEARVKELDEALQFIANCCPEWTARTTAENALKGKVEP